MKYRKAPEDLRRKLLARSVVNETTAVVNGCRCREWGGALHDLGYGRVWDGERLQYAHRVSHEVFIGPIPEGKDVLHRCDNPPCIEERHLWSGTHQENMADRDAKGRNGGWKNAGHGRPATWARGSKHPRAKLTENEARSLKKLLQGRARIKVTVLARQHGVSASLLYGLRDGRNWSWL